MDSFEIESSDIIVASKSTMLMYRSDIYLLYLKFCKGMPLTEDQKILNSNLSKILNFIKWDAKLSELYKKRLDAVTNINSAIYGGKDSFARLKGEEEGIISDIREREDSIMLIYGFQKW